MPVLAFSSQHHRTQAEELFNACEPVVSQYREILKIHKTVAGEVSRWTISNSKVT